MFVSALLFSQPVNKNFMLRKTWQMSRSVALAVACLTGCSEREKIQATALKYLAPNAEH